MTFSFNILNSFGDIPVDILYCREKGNCPVLDMFSRIFTLCNIFKMPPLSSPSTSALCQDDPDCGVRPLWKLKAGSTFHMGWEIIGPHARIWSCTHRSRVSLIFTYLDFSLRHGQNSNKSGPGLSYVWVMHRQSAFLHGGKQLVWLGWILSLNVSNKQ